MNNFAHQQFMFLDLGGGQELNGLSFKLTVNQYSTDNEIQHENLYGNWTFPTIDSWKEYWSSTNRRSLANTKEYVIGKESVKIQNIYCDHDVYKQENHGVAKSLFGMPFEWKDQTKNVLKLN